jgi:hypothetical protein
MRFSVFTPSHAPRYLLDCYRSLQAQTYPDWEWIVVLNSGAEVALFEDDPRVEVYGPPCTNGLHGIGALKRWACDRARGDVFVELDHDDLLHPECLEQLFKVFSERPEIGFAYSNAARFRDDGAHPGSFNTAYGWTPPVQLPTEEARGLITQHAWVHHLWEPTPQAMSRIWFAPDHVRAWRRSTYYQAGGHDPRQEVCDDYSLMLRTYLVTEFARIDRPLYFYRVGNNTSGPGPRNAQIQRMQLELSSQHRMQLVTTWARRHGLMLLDLCSHGNAPAGFQGVDLHAGPGELQADLSKRWPFEDGSVGVIRAQDALEHMADKGHTMSEIYRVLAHGGWLLSDTPSSNGNGADMDPSHVSRWNEKSFWYYTRDAHRRFVAGYPSVPHFQAWELHEHYFGNDYLQRHGIKYVRAHLSAVKDGPRLPGAYELEASYCG